MKEDVTFVGRLLLLMVITAVVAAGCNASGGAPQAPAEPERESFSARRQTEDGAIVKWGGFVEGYEPGMEASFDVSITNETDRVWDGRYCLQLMSNQQPMVLATLEQRPFTLESGVGFSDTLTAQFPETLDDGAYGLSLVVRRPGHPMVDMVPIQIGEADLEHRVTQEDMDAALEACRQVGEPPLGAEALGTRAKADLAERLCISPDLFVVDRVAEDECPDARVGVPEPDKAYAQVITPGFVIRLVAQDQTYVYHAADGRAVLAVEGL
jgi:hypothetical protein